MPPLPNPTPVGQVARPPSRRRIRCPPPKRRRTNLPSANTLPSLQSSPSSPPSPPLSSSHSPSPTPRSPSPPPNVQPTSQSPAKWFRKPSVVWYRGNDLRVEDHPALLAAAQRGGPVVPFFVWDPLDGFGRDLGHVKQWWLRESLKHLKNDLHRLGVQLYTRTGRSTDELRAFVEESGADAVFWNRCYEPDLLKRDEELRVQLAHEGLTAENFKAELLVEPWELSNTDVSPCFETFHSYMRAWMTVPPPPQPFPCPSRLSPIRRQLKSTDIDSLKFDIPSNIEQAMKKVWKPGSTQAKIQLEKFLHEVFPAFGEGRCRRHFDGTSKLSPYIRFGELSPRRMYHSTRLRVSRWDQSAAYAATLQPASFPRRVAVKRPRTGRVKHHLSQNSENKTGDSQSLCREKNGEGDGGREVGAATVRETVSEKQTESNTIGGKGTLRPNLQKERAACKERKNAPVYKRPSLPHISLSARAFLKNLCLRDFAYHVLFHNPDFNKRPLIPEFNSFPWAEDDGSFDSWRNGVTGYPIIDAAMRELHETGWIHNGMRFLLACFLTKYLLLPWSRGLDEFYGLLVDGDHSSNALGWQWTAGSNTDAFPVSCLVNPVKVAYRHDPTGSYVRRWIPELAKLPTEYIHQPWRAPKDLLTEHGIDIGSTYPKRVVLMAEARSRASKAMSVMKQIFAESTVRRGIDDRTDVRQYGIDSLFTGKNADKVQDYPESEPEVLQIDGTQTLQPSSGKIGLLPSLWAILQYDPPSTYLSGNASGSDALIAMDTVSLVEGALPVPLYEQHESIEHALVSAHGQGSTHPALSGVGVLPDAGREIDSSSFSPDPECETGAELRTNASNEGIDIQQLDEPLKYANPELNTFSDQEKQLSRSRPAASVHLSRGDVAGNPTRASQELQPQQNQSTTSGFASTSHNAAFASVAAQYSAAPQPYLQQQIQQFQQLRALGVQHAQQQQQQTLGHLRHPTNTDSRQSQLPVHQPLQGQHDAEPQGSHPQQQRGPSRISHSRSQPSVLQPSQAQTLQQPVPSVQHAQQSQRQHQVHQPHAQNVMDGLCNPHLPSTGIPATAVTGFPHNAPPVVMGPVSSALELPTGHVFGGGDPGAPLYSHHLGMNQFYGIPTIMPVMNTAMGGHLSGAERFEMLGISAAANSQKVLGTSATTNSQKLTVPGMMTLGCSIYGAGVDPSTINNPFAPNGNGIAPANSQNQAHPSQQAPYGLPAHAIFGSQPSAADVSRTQAGGGSNVPRDSQSGTYGQSRPGSVESGERRSQMNTAASMATNTVVAPEVAVNVSSEPIRHGSTKKTDGSLSAEDRSPRVRGSVTPANSSARSHRSTGSVAPTARGPSSRGGAKAGAKGRHSTRSRRAGRASGSASKLNAETRGQTGGRGRGGDRGLQRNRAPFAEKGQATTLKSRLEMLKSVLQSEEHEYHSFARYLSMTYELTGNTDRQTSRDYVRLCNLKDDYHRQYPAEKDKLKIYSMKRFFSQHLSLEVTGEWDRHNHGGVRGPYVYGIRARAQAESSGHDVKADSQRQCEEQTINIVHKR